MILKMSEDKSLTITKSGNTYEDENNAETIKILVPRQINGSDLGECVIHLCVLNQDNLGDEINISTNLKEYNDDLYVADIDITNSITYKNGQIQIWIKVLNTSNEMVAKSSLVTYQIKEHLDIENYIPEQKLSLLDDFSLRMENAVDALEDAITKPPVAGDNGNWYVWDASIGAYKDSGISINIDLTGYVKEDDLNNILERANDYTDKAIEDLNIEISGVSQEYVDDAIEETKSYVDSEIAQIPTGGGGGAVDQTYAPTSANAQSGVAVADALTQYQPLKRLATVVTTEECTQITVDGLNIKSGVVTVLMTTSGNTMTGCNLGINGKIAGGYGGDPKSGVYFIIWKENGTYKAKGRVGGGYNSYNFSTVSGDITSITVENPYKNNGGSYATGTKVTIFEGVYPYGVGQF